jgi:hypothetical protein
VESSESKVRIDAMSDAASATVPALVVVRFHPVVAVRKAATAECTGARSLRYVVPAWA